MEKITECQIFLTRKCNIMCGYCKLIEKQFDNELIIEEWKRAFLLLEKLGIKTVKLMGGEPTVLENLEELLIFINQNTNIKHALLSNSLLSDDRLKSLVNAGLWGYFASVDTIAQESIEPNSIRKAHAGFETLKKLKKMGVKLLGANVVITSKNLENLVETVTILSNEGIWINLCPVIHANNVHGKHDWEYRKVVDKSALLQRENASDLNNTMIKLLQLKQEGLRLAMPDSYLINMSKYGINCGWQCSRLSQIRIDADGALMFCNDIRGEIASKYNIRTLTLETYDEFKEEWRRKRAATNCPGCYWSCFYLAEENMRLGRNEFYYTQGALNEK